MVIDLFPQHCCLRALRHDRWLPSALLQLFFLLVLASNCVTGSCTQVDSNSAKEATAGTVVASAAAATATTAAIEWAMLPPKRSAKACQSLGLLQAATVSYQVLDNTEEEREEEEAKEEKIVEEMEEESSLQAGQQTLKLNHTASNHSDNNASNGLQPVSQSQVSSRGSAFGANRTTLVVPFSAKGSWCNMWTGFQQLSVSLRCRVMALRHIAAPSRRSLAFWALLLVGVLMCVCLLGNLIPAGIVDIVRGTHRSLRAPSGFSGQPQKSRQNIASQHHVPANPQAAPLLPARTPMGQRSPLSLPASSRQPSTVRLSLPAAAETTLSSLPSIGQACLCPELVIPPGYESFLRVPVSRHMKSLYVTDMGDNFVLRVELQVDKAEFMTTDGVLAQCVAVHGSADEFKLLHSNGETFAKLVQSNVELMNCLSHEELMMIWTIRTPAGDEWFFFAACDGSTMEVRDNVGNVQTVAQREKEAETTDQPGDDGNAYLLQIAPLMDVSIALCGLLAVNHLI